MLRIANAGVAWLFVGCVIAQFFLAGLAVFDDLAIFATHRDFGYAFSLLTVVGLVLSLVTRAGRWLASAWALLFGLFMLQSVFVLMRETNPAIAALHPVNGAVILVIALLVARRSTRLIEPAAAIEPRP
jgi:cytochrome b561